MQRRNVLQQQKIALVDNNPNFLKVLKLFLKEFNFMNIKEAYNRLDAIKLVESFQPTIIFIEIELEEKTKSGFYLAKSLRQKNPDLVFIFMSSSMTLNHFEEASFLKPSIFISKDLSRLKLKQALDFVNQLLNSSLNSSNKSDYYREDQQLFLKIEDKLKPFPISCIEFFYVSNKIVYAKVKECQSYTLRTSLKALEEFLYPKFVRVHKNYLINKNEITEVDPKKSVITLNDLQIPLSRFYKKDFLERISFF